MCEAIIIGVVITLVILMICDYRIGYMAGRADTSEQMSGTPFPPAPHTVEDFTMNPLKWEWIMKLRGKPIDPPPTAVSSPPVVLTTPSPDITDGVSTGASTGVSVKPQATPVRAHGSPPAKGWSFNPFSWFWRKSEPKPVNIKESPKPDEKTSSGASMGASTSAPGHVKKDAECCKFNVDPTKYYLTGFPSNNIFTNWHLLK